MKRTLLRTCTSLGLVFAASSAFAGTIYVDANLNTGLNDGSSWANAYQGSDGLRLALVGAVANDDIYVAQGTYKPTTGASRAASFAMKNNVEIYGGFLGGESSPVQRPAFGTATSILLGDLADNDGSNLRNDNSYHLVTTTGTNATAVLDGFEIRQGNANGSGNNNKGGGILCLSNSNPTIRNCDFIDNRCTFGGGAGYINGSRPSFTDCSFVDNLGGSFGGAFDLNGGSNTVFERCTFIGNSANRAGALEIFSTTNILVSNCLFVDNTATGTAGGGGLWLGAGGTATVVNCTIVGNHAPSSLGGGINDQGSNVTTTNCIIWDNTGPGGAQNATNQVNGTAVTYSNVEVGLPGTGNISVAPSFVNAAGGDYNLMITSAGIDAGNNAAVPSGVSLDIRHKRRFEDETSVADTGIGTAPIVDMGCSEFTTRPGTNFCSANVNTQGGHASMAASGSVAVIDNNLTLECTDMVPNQFAIFLVGAQPGFVASPGGSSGNLCLGGVIGRFNDLSQIRNTGATSSIDLTLDLGNLPLATGSVPVMPGETWHFEAWYRDGIPSIGFVTSNFSDGLSITFE
ncbi:MAG: right-handed parallel beta-helix repeat-containing protein [Planctomycetota bacterium]|nr:right-handed parallel beta-helix repeat-containing protein [Planctomycetota bacterium]